MPGVENLSLLGKLSSQFEIINTPIVTTVEEIVRPFGYSINGTICVRSVIESQGKIAEGWGTGTPTIAPLKAFSEAIERFVMFSKAGADPTICSSNGWASHTNLDAAKERATAELVERDTALRTWFDGGPYLKVPTVFWPVSLVKWSAQALANSVEFRHASVLLADGPFGSCVSVLLQTDDVRTVVGHASGADLTSAIESAFFESLRSAHAALRFEDFAETIDLHAETEPTIEYGPGANGMAYAYGSPIPELAVHESDSNEIRLRWLQHQSKLKINILKARYQCFQTGDRFVVRSMLSGIQDVFWGRTPKDMNVKNKFPHFVG